MCPHRFCAAFAGGVALPVQWPFPFHRRDGLQLACVCKFVCSSCFCCYFLLLVLIILLLCFLNYSYCLTLPGYDDVDVRSGGVGDQD